MMSCHGWNANLWDQFIHYCAEDHLLYHFGISTFVIHNFIDIYKFAIYNCNVRGFKTRQWQNLYLGFLYY